MNTSCPERTAQLNRKRRWHRVVPAPFGVVRWLSAAAITLLATLATGCLEEDAAPAPATTPSVAATSPTTATATRAAPSPTPLATATPTPAHDPAKETAAAIEAAAVFLGAVHLESLDRAACEAANPPSRICISLQSAPGHVGRGIARFTAGDLDLGGFVFFMGRMPGGEWGFWFGTQQQHDVLETLPGTLLACGRGEDVAIRAQPALEADVLQRVGELVELQAETFVLTVEGSFTAGGTTGEGWYQVSAPAVGFVAATDVTAASLGDCLLRDALRGDRG